MSDDTSGDNLSDWVEAFREAIGDWQPTEISFATEAGFRRLQEAAKIILDPEGEPKKGSKPLKITCLDTGRVFIVGGGDE